MGIIVRHLRLLITCALLGGCGQPVPIKIGGGGERGTSASTHEDDLRVIAEVSAILDLPLEITDRRYGSIVVHFRDAIDTDPRGSILLQRPCLKIVTTNRDSGPAAHEVAHALGLEHVCEGEDCADEETDNLMAVNITGVLGLELTAEQHDDLARGQRRLTACR